MKLTNILRDSAAVVAEVTAGLVVLVGIATSLAYGVAHTAGIIS